MRVPQILQSCCVLLIIRLSQCRVVHAYPIRMNLQSNPPHIHEALRALVTSGFTLEQANRNPGYALLVMFRYDEFGTKTSYCFVLADESLSESQADAAKIAADHHDAQLVVVGPETGEIDTLDWSRFIGLLGGPIPSLTPLDEDFRENLVVLGQNELPAGYEGAPDELYESYVWAGLSFLLGGRAVRYGQERLFESVPDGLVLQEPDFIALYDAKAYSSGYEITADSIRQFASYIEDFLRRYSPYFPRINTFIVASSIFSQQPGTLVSRSQELQARCGAPIAFVTSEALADAISIILDNPRTRQSINWSQVFANPIFDSVSVNHEVRRIIEDRVVPK